MPSSMLSTDPLTDVSGVRSSWETLETKSDLSSSISRIWPRPLPQSGHVLNPITDRLCRFEAEIVSSWRIFMTAPA